MPNGIFDINAAAAAEYRPAQQFNTTPTLVEQQNMHNAYDAGYADAAAEEQGTPKSGYEPKSTAEVASYYQGRGEYNRNAHADRSFLEATGDTIKGAGAGFVSGVGSLAGVVEGAVEGAVNPYASIDDTISRNLSGVQKVTDLITDSQSDALKARKQAQATRNNLQEQLDQAQYEQDIANGMNPIEASTRNIGRGIYRYLSSSDLSTVSDDVAQAVGSTIVPGGLAKVGSKAASLAAAKFTGKLATGQLGKQVVKKSGENATANALKADTGIFSSQNLKEAALMGSIEASSNAMQSNTEALNTPIEDLRQIPQFNDLVSDYMMQGYNKSLAEQKARVALAGNASLRTAIYSLPAAIAASSIATWAMHPFGSMASKAIKATREAKENLFRAGTGAEAKAGSKVGANVSEAEIKATNAPEMQTRTNTSTNDLNNTKFSKTVDDVSTTPQASNIADDAVSKINEPGITKPVNATATKAESNFNSNTGIFGSEANNTNNVPKPINTKISESPSAELKSPTASIDNEVKLTNPNQDLSDVRVTPVNTGSNNTGVPSVEIPNVNNKTAQTKSTSSIPNTDSTDLAVNNNSPEFNANSKQPSLEMGAKGVETNIPNENAAFTQAQATPNSGTNNAKTGTAEMNAKAKTAETNASQAQAETPKANTNGSQQSTSESKQVLTPEEKIKQLKESKVSSKDALKDTWRTMKTEATEEALQGLTGSAAGNLAAKETYDPKRRLLEDAGYSIAQGAVAGGLSAGALRSVPFTANALRNSAIKDKIRAEELKIRKNKGKKSAADSADEIIGNSNNAKTANTSTEQKSQTEPKTQTEDKQKSQKNSQTQANNTDESIRAESKQQSKPESENVYASNKASTDEKLKENATSDDSSDTDSSVYKNPLFTHPLRSLTSEDIDKVFDKDDVQLKKYVKEKKHNNNFSVLADVVDSLKGLTEKDLQGPNKNIYKKRLAVCATLGAMFDFVDDCFKQGKTPYLAQALKLSENSEEFKRIGQATQEMSKIYKIDKTIEEFNKFFNSHVDQFTKDFYKSLEEIKKSPKNKKLKESIENSSFILHTISLTNPNLVPRGTKLDLVQVLRKLGKEKDAEQIKILADLEEELSSVKNLFKNRVFSVTDAKKTRFNLFGKTIGSKDSAADLVENFAKALVISDVESIKRNRDIVAKLAIQQRNKAEAMQHYNEVNNYKDGKITAKETTPVTYKALNPNSKNFFTQTIDRSTHKTSPKIIFAEANHLEAIYSILNKAVPESTRNSISQLREENKLKPAQSKFIPPESLKNFFKSIKDDYEYYPFDYEPVESFEDTQEPEQTKQETNNSEPTTNKVESETKSNTEAKVEPKTTETKDIKTVDNTHEEPDKVEESTQSNMGIPKDEKYVPKFGKELDNEVEKALEDIKPEGKVEDTKNGVNENAENSNSTESVTGTTESKVEDIASENKSTEPKEKLNGEIIKELYGDDKKYYELTEEQKDKVRKIDLDCKKTTYERCFSNPTKEQRNSKFKNFFNVKEVVINKIFKPRDSSAPAYDNPIQAFMDYALNAKDCLVEPFKEVILREFDMENPESYAYQFSRAIDNSFKVLLNNAGLSEDADSYESDTALMSRLSQQRGSILMYATIDPKTNKLVLDPKIKALLTLVGFATLKKLPITANLLNLYKKNQDISFKTGNGALDLEEIHAGGVDSATAQNVIESLLKDYLNIKNANSKNAQNTVSAFLGIGNILVKTALANTSADIGMSAGEQTNRALIVTRYKSRNGLINDIGKGAVNDKNILSAFKWVTKKNTFQDNNSFSVNSSIQNRLNIPLEAVDSFLGCESQTAFTVNRKVTKVRNTQLGSNTPLTKMQQESLRRTNNKEHHFDTRMGTLYLDLGSADNVARMADDYVNPENLEKDYTPSARESIKGTQLSYGLSYDTFTNAVSAIKASIANSEDGSVVITDINNPNSPALVSEQVVRFKYNKTSVNRNQGIHGTDPVGSKLMRESFLATTAKNVDISTSANLLCRNTKRSTFNLKKLNSLDQVNRVFLLGLAQAFDVKIEKLDPVDSITQTIELFNKMRHYVKDNNPKVYKYLLNLHDRGNKFNKGEELPLLDGAFKVEIAEAIKNSQIAAGISPNLATVHAFVECMALQHLINKASRGSNVESRAKAKEELNHWTTNIYIGYDGITNGVANANIQLQGAMGTIPSKFITVAERCGFVPGRPESHKEALGNYASDEDEETASAKTDCYTAAAKDVTKNFAVNIDSEENRATDEDAILAFSETIADGKYFPMGTEDDYPQVVDLFNSVKYKFAKISKLKKQFAKAYQDSIQNSNNKSLQIKCNNLGAKLEAQETAFLNKFRQPLEYYLKTKFSDNINSALQLLLMLHPEANASVVRTNYGKYYQETIKEEDEIRNKLQEIDLNNPPQQTKLNALVRTISSVQGLFTRSFTKLPFTQASYQAQQKTIVKTLLDEIINSLNLRLSRALQKLNNSPDCKSLKDALGLTDTQYNSFKHSLKKLCGSCFVTPNTSTIKLVSITNEQTQETTYRAYHVKTSQLQESPYTFIDEFFNKVDKPGVTRDEIIAELQNFAELKGSILYERALANLQIAIGKSLYDAVTSTTTTSVHRGHALITAASNVAFRIYNSFYSAKRKEYIKTKAQESKVLTKEEKDSPNAANLKVVRSIKNFAENGSYSEMQEGQILLSSQEENEFQDNLTYTNLNGTVVKAPKNEIQLSKHCSPMSNEKGSMQLRDKPMSLSSKVNDNLSVDNKPMEHISNVGNANLDSKAYSYTATMYNPEAPGVKNSPSGTIALGDGMTQNLTDIHLSEKQQKATLNTHDSLSTGVDADVEVPETLNKAADEAARTNGIRPYFNLVRPLVGLFNTIAYVDFKIKNKASDLTVSDLDAYINTLENLPNMYSDLETYMTAAFQQDEEMGVKEEDKHYLKYIDYYLKKDYPEIIDRYKKAVNNYSTKYEAYLADSVNVQKPNFVQDLKEAKVTKDDLAKISEYRAIVAKNLSTLVQDLGLAAEYQDAFLEAYTQIPKLLGQMGGADATGLPTYNDGEGIASDCELLQNSIDNQFVLSYMNDYMHAKVDNHYDKNTFSYKSQAKAGEVPSFEDYYKKNHAKNSTAERKETAKTIKNKSGKPFTSSPQSKTRVIASRYEEVPKSYIEKIINKSLSELKEAGLNNKTLTALSGYIMGILGDRLRDITVYSGTTKMLMDCARREGCSVDKLNGPGFVSKNKKGEPVIFIVVSPDVKLDLIDNLDTHLDFLHELLHVATQKAIFSGDPETNNGKPINPETKAVLNNIGMLRKEFLTKIAPKYIEYLNQATQNTDSDTVKNAIQFRIDKFNKFLEIISNESPLNASANAEFIAYMCTNLLYAGEDLSKVEKSSNLVDTSLYYFLTKAQPEANKVSHSTLQKIKTNLHTFIKRISLAFTKLILGEKIVKAYSIGNPNLNKFIDNVMFHTGVLMHQNINDYGLTIGIDEKTKQAEIDIPVLNTIDLNPNLESIRNIKENINVLKGSKEKLKQKFRKIKQNTRAESKLSEAELRTFKDNISYVDEHTKLMQADYVKEITNNFVDSMHNFGVNLSAGNINMAKKLFCIMQVSDKLNKKALNNVQLVYENTLNAIAEESLAKYGLTPKQEQLYTSLFNNHSLSGLSKDISMPNLTYFTVLSQVDPTFRGILQDIQLKLKNESNDYDNAVNQFIADFGNTASSYLLGVNSLNKDKSALAMLDASLDVISDENIKNNPIAPIINLTAKLNNALNGHASKLTNYALEHTADALKDFSANTDKELLRSVSEATRTVLERLTMDNSESLLKLAAHPKVPNVLMDLLKDLVNRSSVTNSIYILNKKAKAVVQGTRERCLNTIPKLARGYFKEELGRDLQTHESRAMFNLFGKLDLTAIKYSEVHDLLDIGTRKQKIQEIKAELSDLLGKRLSYADIKSKQLGRYLATGIAGDNLLKNAYIICKQVNTNADPDRVSYLIDKLASAYGIEYIDPGMQESLRNLMDTAPEAIEFTFNFLKNARQANLNTVSGINGNQGLYNLTKGFLPKVYTDDSAVILVPDYHSTKYINLGFERIKGSSKPGYSYYYRSYDPTATFNQGALQIIHSQNMGVDINTGLPKGTNFNILNFNKNEYAQYRAARNYMSTAVENEAPIFNENGKIIGYEHIGDPEVLASKPYSEDLIDIMANLYSRNQEQIMAFEFNKSLGEQLAKIYKESDANSKQLFVDIAKSTDPVIKDAWNTASHEAKNILLRAFNPNAISKDEMTNPVMIRRDMLNDVIGERQAALTDAYTGVSRFSPTSQKYFRAVANAILGDKALKILTYADRDIKNIASIARNTIVVKSIQVAYGNIVSNLGFLAMSGIPVTTIYKESMQAYRELEWYTRAQKNIAKWEIQLRGLPNNSPKRALLETKIDQKNAYIRDGLSIYPMIEAGEFNTIADIGSQYSKNQLELGKVGEFFEDCARHLPNSVKTASSYVFLTQDNPIYQGLQKATQYGDFIAKVVLYNHLLRQGLPIEEALMHTADAFVDYDRQRGRWRGGLEDFGLLWFWNFKLRSTKQALYLAKHRPLSSLMFLTMPVDDTLGKILGIEISSPLSDNAISSLIRGRTGTVGPGMYTGAVTSLPWYNLLF